MYYYVKKCTTEDLDLFAKWSYVCQYVHMYMHNGVEGYTKKYTLQN